MGERAEYSGADQKMKKIIINCNDCFAAYKFRLGLIRKLEEHYDITVVAAFDHYAKMLSEEHIDVRFVESESTGTNVVRDLKLFCSYRRIFKEINPDILINYTVKPHTYGALAAPKKTKVINVVSGVGSAFSEDNMIFQIVKNLYKMAAHKVDHYIFLNQDDYELFQNLNLLRQAHSFLDSEGVDLEKFDPYVDFSKPLTFLFSGRLVREKGILEYLEAAKIIKRKFPEVRFLVAGSFYKKHSAIPRSLIDENVKAGIITYMGHCYDMNLLYHDVHCVVLPSYREGMPISLIEGLAAKKFLIACDVPGSRDVIQDGYNGFLAAPRSGYDLAFTIEKYIRHPDKEKLHSQAYSSSRRFDQNAIIRKMVEILEGM